MESDLRVERDIVVPELASMKAGVEPRVVLACPGRHDGLKRWVNMEEDGIGTDGNGDLYIFGNILRYLWAGLLSADE
jgi:hypothetical protein